MDKRKKFQGIVCAVLVGVLLLGLVSSAVIILLGR